MRGRLRERLRGSKQQQKQVRGRLHTGNQTEKLGVSIYVTNLPSELDKYGLRGIFSRIGMVVDSHIPQGSRIGSRSKYGFVRFASKQEAIKSIQLLNSKFIRGHKISISLAKSDSPRRRLVRQQIPQTKHLRKVSTQQRRGVWRRINKAKEAKSQKDTPAQHFGQQVPLSKPVIGKVNEDFIPWLSTSLVCTSQEPRDVATLASAINCGYGQGTKIYALSGYKFILTFPNETAMEEALHKPEELQSWFSEIKKWDKYERCSTRKVWLEIIGVPPHGWLWENFKTIADIWGYLICLSKPIMRTDSFDTMKVLIETDILAFIEDDIVLMIEDMGFRISIKETNSPYIVTQGPKFPHSEDVDSNGTVPGFEDLANSSADRVAPAISLGGNSHNPEQIQCCARNRPNSKMVIGVSSSGTGKTSADTDSRTKTAQFSHNVDSNEVLMNSNKFKKLPADLGDTGINLAEEEESPREPPGFEKRNSYQECSASSFGHRTQLPELHEKEANEYGQNKGRTEANAVTTTAQDESNLQNSNQLDKYERVAQEALHIGEILGLKVVSNREAAVYSLAESMRLQHKTRTSNKRPVRAEVSLN